MIILELSECGVPAESVSFRIVGGVETGVGEFPWLTAIFENEAKMLNHSEVLCSGNLIGDKWVMTAAHCIPK